MGEYKQRNLKMKNSASQDKLGKTSSGESMRPQSAPHHQLTTHSKTDSQLFENLKAQLNQDRMLQALQPVTDHVVQAQKKYQFDIIIQKVEIQIVALSSTTGQPSNQSVNTKRKIRVDPQNKVAIFSGERISIIRNAPPPLSPGQQIIDENSDNNSTGLTSAQPNQILVQMRLYAFYNAKDKAIGMANVDLGQFIGKAGKGQLCKVMFLKCFDKNANITFEVRVKEVASNVLGTYISKAAQKGSSLNPISEEEGNEEAIIDEGRLEIGAAESEEKKDEEVYENDESQVELDLQSSFKEGDQSPGGSSHKQNPYLLYPDSARSPINPSSISKQNSNSSSGRHSTYLGSASQPVSRTLNSKTSPHKIFSQTISIESKDGGLYQENLMDRTMSMNKRGRF